MSTVRKKYKITRLFIGGPLEGLTYENEQDWPMKVGLTVKKPLGLSPYKIIACEEIG